MDTSLQEIVDQLKHYDKDVLNEDLNLKISLVFRRSEFIYLNYFLIFLLFCFLFFVLQKLLYIENEVGAITFIMKVIFLQDLTVLQKMIILHFQK